MSAAFQPGAFQSDAFQTDEGTVTPPTPPAPPAAGSAGLGGGFFGGRRSYRGGGGSLATPAPEWDEFQDQNEVLIALVIALEEQGEFA